MKIQRARSKPGCFQIRGLNKCWDLSWNFKHRTLRINIGNASGPHIQYTASVSLHWLGVGGFDISPRLSQSIRLKWFLQSSPGPVRVLSETLLPKTCEHQFDSGSPKEQKRSLHNAHDAYKKLTETWITASMSYARVATTKLKPKHKVPELRLSPRYSTA